MSTDEEVEQLLRRTRAARERVNNRMAAIGESGHPIRSPLRSPFKERSNVSGSPLKDRMGSPLKDRIGSPLKDRMGSPLKDRLTTTVGSKSPQKSPIKVSPIFSLFFALHRRSSLFRLSRDRVRPSWRLRR